jgi:hypothetical protein
MLRISKLRALVLALLAAVSLPAQTGDKPAGAPPEEVDRALRARINEFNDLQVKGQYRKAEAYVAEETKDFYYSLGKPKYKSLAVLSVEYSDNFTRAKAIINCERYINAPPYPPDVPLKGRFISLWKLENGNWFYYEDLSSRETPMGKIFSGVTPPAGPSSDSPALPPGLPAIPATVDGFLNHVKAETGSVTLKPGGSARVTFASSAPGPMGLVVDSRPSGIDAKLDSAEVPANGKAELTIHAAKDAKSGTVTVRVIQTTEVIPIQVTVK